MKKLFAIVLCLAMVITMATACTSNNQSSTPPASEAPESVESVEAGKVDPNIEATLVFAYWDNLSDTLYQDLDLQGKFQELYPNVKIEYEKLKDDTEYWTAMQTRATANQLPDIMYNKTFTFARFSSYLVDLSELEAVNDNMLAKGYAYDGKVLGIPEKQGGDYVFYWKDMFDTAGVSLPNTWGEFVDMAKALQEYYVKDNKDFMAIALGAKDEWPTYPFTEFMPAAQSGDGQYWNNMTKQDAPFAEGTDIYKCYMKINDLFSSGAFGKDPNGITHDQAVSLFAQKKASIMVTGAWALDTIKESADNNIDGLQTFYMPFRDNASDPFNYTTQGDSFLSVTTNSQNPDLGKEFVEFYFSKKWYPDFLDNIPDDTTSKTFQKTKDPVLAYADAQTTDRVLITYDGGGDDFTNLQAETKFDYKKLGAEMMVSGFDLAKRLGELDTAWAAARTKLAIQ